MFIKFFHLQIELIRKVQNEKELPSSYKYPSFSTIAMKCKSTLSSLFGTSDCPSRALALCATESSPSVSNIPALSSGFNLTVPSRNFFRCPSGSLILSFKKIRACISLQEQHGCEATNFLVDDKVTYLSCWQPHGWGQ